MRRGLWWLLPGLLGAGWPGGGERVEAMPGGLERVVWSAPEGGSALSSPVLHGGVVYVTAEPNTLVALDVATGAVRWSRSHGLEQIVQGEALAEMQSRKAEADALSAELASVREQIGVARRDARRSGGGRAELDRLRARADAITAQLTAVAPLFTPERGDGLGYANPTPWVDEQGVYVSFGTGAVASWSHDGELRWWRWLGHGAAPERGYVGTDTASPVRIGETLLVAHGALHGLDASTGETRWSGPAYADYGSPAVMRVGGRELVFTPDGQALHARTGEVVAKDLGDTFYVGPTVVQDRVYWVGRNDGQMDAPVRVAAHRVTLDGEELKFELLFKKELPIGDRVYAHAAAVPDGLFVVSVRGHFAVIDPLDGRVLRKGAVEGLKGQIWTNPLWVGDRVVLLSREGELVQLGAQAPWAELSRQQVPASVAVPAFVVGGVVLRGAEGVERRGG